LAVLSTVFFAGIYYKDLTDRLSKALEKVEKHEQQLLELRPRVETTSELIVDLREWSNVAQDGSLSGMPGGNGYPESRCPDGHYAVGIRSWGTTPGVRYCIGCLQAVQLICRPLNVQAGN
jgi:hypothetical protein